MGKNQIVDKTPPQSNKDKHKFDNQPPSTDKSENKYKKGVLAAGRYDRSQGGAVVYGNGEYQTDRKPRGNSSENICRGRNMIIVVSNTDDSFDNTDTWTFRRL